MAITDRAIDQAFSDLKGKCGGVRNDYFGLLYIEQEFHVERDRAMSQIAFGGNDFGIDGFHFDPDKRNLYLFQFKWTESHGQFKESFRRLIEAGMDQIFGSESQNQHVNQLILKLKSCLIENEAIIERVMIHFVFAGDPEEAERSQVLDKLREDLENKKYLIDQRLGRPVTLVIEFRSARSHKIGSASHVRRTHTYTITLSDIINHTGPNHEKMTVGFIPLVDLQKMYAEMGERFFDRNIRAALPEDKAVNRSIQKSIRRIVLEGKDEPSIFAFHHNGVTLSAEAIHYEDGQYKLTEPRLLNGAQTVTTFSRFLKLNEKNNLLEARKESLKRLLVLCRIITDAERAFITNVTINNNRQNPVDPWNLHANDEIQLEIQDKFQKELGIYYERQERMFEKLGDDELDEKGITERKAIELVRLAQTLLASDGELDRMKHLRQVFEEEKFYNQVFSTDRLRADGRKIVLCYKIQFRLRRLMEHIIEKGANKYSYVKRARNLLWALLCQGILNDPDLEEMSEDYGQSLGLEAQYTEWLSTLATTRCRFILSDLVADKAYATKVNEGNYGFMNSNSAYKRSMEIAYKRWKWVEKRLK